MRLRRAAATRDGAARPRGCGLRMSGWTSGSKMTNRRSEDLCRTHREGRRIVRPCADERHLPMRAVYGFIAEVRRWRRPHRRSSPLLVRSPRWRRSCRRAPARHRRGAGVRRVEHVEVAAPEREGPAGPLIDAIEVALADDLAGLRVDLADVGAAQVEVVRVERVEASVARACELGAIDRGSSPMKVSAKLLVSILASPRAPLPMPRSSSSPSRPRCRASPAGRRCSSSRSPCRRSGSSTGPRRTRSARMRRSPCSRGRSGRP